MHSVFPIFLCPDLRPQCPANEGTWGKCGASPGFEEAQQNSGRLGLTSTGDLGALSHPRHNDHLMDLGSHPAPLSPQAASSLEGWLLP